MRTLPAMLALGTALCAAPASVSVSAHSDPPNLLEVDCALYSFATTFGATKFPAAPAEITEALASAFHLERCNNTIGSRTAPLSPSHAGARWLGGYRMDPMPAAFYRDAEASHQPPDARSMFVAVSGGPNHVQIAGAGFGALAFGSWLSGAGFRVLSLLASPVHQCCLLCQS